MTSRHLHTQILCVHKFSVGTNPSHTQILYIHNTNSYTNSLLTQIHCIHKFSVCTNTSHTQYFCRDTQILCIHKFSVYTISLHVQCTTTAVHTSIIACMHDVLVHSRPLPLHSGRSVINLPWLLGGCQKDCMLYSK